MKERKWKKYETTATITSATSLIILNDWTLVYLFICKDLISMCKLHFSYDSRMVTNMTTRAMEVKKFPPSFLGNYDRPTNQSTARWIDRVIGEFHFQSAEILLIEIIHLIWLLDILDRCLWRRTIRVTRISTTSVFKNPHVICLFMHKKIDCAY